VTQSETILNGTLLIGTTGRTPKANQQTPVLLLARYTTERSKTRDTGCSAHERSDSAIIPYSWVRSRGRERCRPVLDACVLGRRGALFMHTRSAAVWDGHMHTSIHMTLQATSSRIDPLPPLRILHIVSQRYDHRSAGLRQTAYSDAVDFLPELRHGAAAAKGSRSRMEDRHRVETLPHVRTVSADDSTAQEDAAAQPEDALPDAQEEQQQQQQQQPQPAFFAVRDVETLCFHGVVWVGCQAAQAQLGRTLIS